MKYVCPLCNGLYTVQRNCIKCNGSMDDQGAVVNYHDNYSPYLLDEITNNVDGVRKDQCLHLFRCTDCGFEESYAIQREIY
ncbi:MAG TPA: hypothetical protein GXX53_09270 [Tissierellia bacterium]|nr:hypothetical protein [Tissierellia bacterium]